MIVIRSARVARRITRMVIAICHPMHHFWDPVERMPIKMTTMISTMMTCTMMIMAIMMMTITMIFMTIPIWIRKKRLKTRLLPKKMTPSMVVRWPGELSIAFGLASNLGFRGHLLLKSKFFQTHPRKSRSVSSGDGESPVPIIDESYASIRQPSKNKSVEHQLAQHLQRNAEESPKLTYDWSDKR